MCRSEALWTGVFPKMRKLRGQRNGTQAVPSVACNLPFFTVYRVFTHTVVVKKVESLWKRKSVGTDAHIGPKRKKQKCALKTDSSVVKRSDR